ncbi:hypothetical protein [Methanosarcina sp.]|uniref:hypothetical protein n=1 Tax=Methanosarcina sp. TaxID=2213 RepID=UPI003C77D458
MFPIPTGATADHAGWGLGIISTSQSQAFAVFDQTFFEKVCDQALFEKVAFRRLIKPTISFSLKPFLKRLAIKLFFEKACEQKVIYK